ncbi:MAG: vanadium-dependent haloperoxidase [Fluviicola sp.]
MNRNKSYYILLIILFSALSAKGQDSEKSVARIWIDAHLRAIQKDGLGPTIHSRNLYQLSAGMYDLWTVFKGDKEETIFLGKGFGDFPCEFEGYPVPENRDSAVNVAINYYAFRLTTARFGQYSSKGRTHDIFVFEFDSTGLDPSFRSTDYSSGSPAALGNYLAEKMIEFAWDVDPASELEGYEGIEYETANTYIKPNVPGVQRLEDPDRWQPISARGYIAEKGWSDNLLDWYILLAPTEDVFLTPHWSEIEPFALNEKHETWLEKDGQNYRIYLDPGAPPYTSNSPAEFDAYRWNFELVARWSQFNTPFDETIIDISPAAVGRSSGLLPNTFEEYKAFFNEEQGGTLSKEARINPATNKKYAKHLVKRGDYTRCIAEYWVDGVGTYTPPGHWVSILREVSDHPDFKRKWRGKGAELSQLEWDVKSYMALTGALHDSGIAAWSSKVAYDYVRPITAIRWMAGNGQATDSLAPNYHPKGLHLIPGSIEQVQEGDPLAGENNEHVGKIKLYAWRGPNSVENQQEDVGGVDWILAENWWPYQQYAFPTPPFAGYVSGHSTFSTSASEIMTYITGDPFFPGGMATHTFKKDSFLKFEKGPSEDLTLQWATYREASDETCLSRIYGGIHPPIDDIRGRQMGVKVATIAIEKVESLLGD